MAPTKDRTADDLQVVAKRPAAAAGIGTDGDIDASPVKRGPGRPKKSTSLTVGGTTKKSSPKKDEPQKTPDDPQNLPAPKDHPSPTPEKIDAPITLDADPQIPQTSVPDLVGGQTITRKKEDVPSKRRNAAESPSEFLSQSCSTSKANGNSSKADVVPTPLEVAQGVYDRLMSHKADVESRLPVIESEHAKRIQEFEDSIRVVVHAGSEIAGFESTYAYHEHHLERIKQFKMILSELVLDLSRGDRTEPYNYMHVEELIDSYDLKGDGQQCPSTLTPFKSEYMVIRREEYDRLLHQSQRRSSSTSTSRSAPKSEVKSEAKLERLLPPDDLHGRQLQYWYTNHGEFIDRYPDKDPDPLGDDYLNFLVKEIRRLPDNKRDLGHRFTRSIRDQVGGPSIRSSVSLTSIKYWISRRPQEDDSHLFTGRSAKLYTNLKSNSQSSE